MTPGVLARLRRAALGAALVTLLLASTTPALAGPAAVAPLTETQAEAAQRERAALADLEDSSAQVQAAAVALQRVAAQLPAAQAAVARARGELAGARARVAAANAAVEEAVRDRTTAEQAVRVADGKVDQGREEVGLLARRSYQRGRLGDLQDVIEAGEPQDVLERASMMRKVFEHQDGTLQRLTKARLSLARTKAGLAAQERAVSRARVRAQAGEARARDITVEAERAASRVQALAAQRAAVLTGAEALRAQDQRDYAQAQADSRALAERIREAARKAAIAEAKRKAAEKKAAAAAEAARKRALAAGKPAPRRRAAPQGDTSSNGEGMRWPCAGCPLTSRYGYRTHPIYGDVRFHAGVDMGAPIGTTVHASDAGVVTYAGYASGYGTLVIVSHGVVNGRDLSTAYAHMSALSVSEGQRVGKYEKVGEVGNEGNSTGPHLHFEVRRDGDPVDPLDYVDPP